MDRICLNQLMQQTTTTFINGVFVVLGKHPFRFAIDRIAFIIACLVFYETLEKIKSVGKTPCVLDFALCQLLFKKLHSPLYIFRGMADCTCKNHRFDHRQMCFPHARLSLTPYSQFIRGNAWALKYYCFLHF